MIVGYKEDVAAIARAAAAAHHAGATTYEKNGLVFDLVEAGWCGRFVRQCYAAAARNLHPQFSPYGFPWLRRYAAEVCDALEQLGYRTEHPEPGDIVGMSPGGRLPGHIGIYLGSQIAENTSSRVRGPGTVLSPTSSLQHLITGYYAVFPSRGAANSPCSLQVVAPDGRLIACQPEESHGVTRADLRPLIEALGFTCHYRVWEDGRRRIYLKPSSAAIPL